MTRKMLLSMVVTNLALAGWAIGSRALVGWQSHALIQDTTLVAGRAIAAWTLHNQHQHEHTYYRSAGQWNFELAALRSKLLPQAPDGARLGPRQRQPTPRAPPQRKDPELPASRGARAAADVRAHPRRHHPQQHRRAAPEAVGRRTRLPRGLPGSPRAPRCGDRAGGGTAQTRAEQRIFDGLDEPLARDGVAD